MSVSGASDATVPPLRGRGTGPSTARDGIATAEAAGGRPRGAGPAARVELSASAKAALEKAAADRQAVAAATRSLDEQVQARTDALAATLGTAFKREGIPLDEAIALRTDGLGGVVTDSPYKKKIEKIFRDDPELAQEFKSVASLKAMQAAQKSLELYENEKKGARNRDERDAAYGRYNGRLLDIQKLSGVMTLKDGALASAAEDYMATLSAPMVTDPRGDVFRRYESILRVPS